MRRVLSLLVAALMLGACARQPAEATLAGSTSVQPLAEMLADAYTAAGGGRVRVQGGGSAAGIRAVRDGIAEIGAASRRLTPDEAKGLHVHLVAWDALAIVVHPTNPIRGLSADDVRRIYTGKATLWPNGRPIHSITREHGSGTREAMAGFVAPAGEIDARAIVLNSNGAIRSAVASDPDAIGYISLGALADGGVRAIAIGGKAPVPEAIRTGRYPLARPFLFLTRGESRFIQFVLGPQGRVIVQQEGLVPPK